MNPTSDLLKDVIKSVYNEVHTCLRKMPTHSIWDFGDLVNEGVTVFYGACTGYDKTHGTNFNTYLVACLKYHFTGILQGEWKQQTKKVDWENFDNTPKQPELHRTPTVEDLISPKKVSKQALTLLEQVLNPSDKTQLRIDEWWKKAKRRDPRAVKNIVGKLLGLSQFQVNGLVTELRRAAI